MPEYTVWEQATGKITRSGSASDTAIQAREGEKVYEGEALDDMRWRFDVATELPVEYVYLPTVEEYNNLINLERDRRIEKGKTFSGIYVTGKEKDGINLTNLAVGALTRLTADKFLEPTPTVRKAELVTKFRDGHNVHHDLVQDQMLNLWGNASLYVESIYKASWAIKAMDPVPPDYMDDKYWPSYADTEIVDLFELSPKP